MHPDCYDDELENEFLQLDDWHWYSDMDGQHELSKDYIRQTGGPNPIHVSMKYLDLHCAYTWRKLHRAVIRQALIDDNIGIYSHTEHCSGALATSKLKDTVKAPPRFFHLFT